METSNQQVRGCIIMQQEAMGLSVSGERNDLVNKPFFPSKKKRGRRARDISGLFRR